MISVVMDAGSVYTVKRFGWKVAILSAFALAQVKAPWGFKGAVTILALVSGILSLALALYWRERPRVGALNYWDEAVAFFGIAGLVHWLL
jgi:hypothetical protein